MRLISLSANHSSFRTVRFNRTGLTIISGSKSHGGGTYNGVGKSLIIELLHFCLGSNKNKEFEKKLPQWVFSLEFEILGSKHAASRNTAKQNVLILDGEEVSLSKFRQWIEDRTFSIPAGIAGLKFRSLLSRFLRRGQKEYNDPKNVGDYTDYDVLLRNAFLLGIDVRLIAQKADTRKTLVELQQLRKNFREDPLLNQFYLGNKDADIHLSFLEQQIAQLEKNKTAFVVAENYYDLQKEANDLARNIEKQKNSLFLINNTVSNIDNSIKEHPDLSSEQLKLFYGELMQTFKADALKQLNDVASFHQRLLEKRLSRLSSEKLSLVERSKDLSRTLKSAQKELDQKLKVLGNAQALDQYTAIVNQIALLNSQAQKLRDYKEIDIEYSNREAELGVQQSEQVVATNSYLEETKEEREKNFSIFKNFASRFYPTVPAGISIKNNEGDNTLRFNFDVRIENDSSDGINEVRIFCYDMTLLELRRGHSIDFLFHDSRLYSNMDERQRAELFRIAHEETKSKGRQYIATLNPDQITSIKNEFSEQEFKDIISNNVVLELQDASAEGKLLGIQIDLNYDNS